MILVVDDDEGMITLLRTALEVEGFDVVTAHDGVAAYRLVRSPECRCIVLDIKMPRINGVELLLLMQADGVRVPAIVMAGSGDFQESEMKEFANVVAYLPKPFALEDMVRAIRQHARS